MKNPGGGLAVLDTAGDRVQRLFQSALVFLIFCVMATWAVINGTFYDDEVFNIRNVSFRDVAGLIHYANTQDLHPPGSYILNRVLLDLFHNSWEAVKVIDGFLNGLALAFFFWMAWRRLSPRARLFLGVLLATAATLVLWGASVRWYAYYNPLFMTAAALLLFSDLGRNGRTAILCLFAVLMFHINYVTFCSVPVLLVLHVGREWRGFRSRPRDAWLLLAGAAVALAVCIPQLIVFATVHYTRNSGQISSPLYALIQVLFTLGLGHGVFPLALISLVTAAVLVSAGAYVLVRYPLSPEEKLALAAVIVGILLMSLSGLGFKPRNATYLLPLAWFLTASWLAKLPRYPRWGVAFVVGIFQLLGAYDVMAHHRTAKGSYNIDYRAVMGVLHQWQGQCPAGLMVFNHDAVLGELLFDSHMAQSSPLFTSKPGEIGLPAQICYALVKTYHEPFDRSMIETLYQSLQGRGTRIAARDMSPDLDYKAKGWIAHERFSPFYVHLELYRVEKPSSVPAWYRQTWAYDFK